MKIENTRTNLLSMQANTHRRDRKPNSPCVCYQEEEKMFLDAKSLRRCVSGPNKLNLVWNGTLLYPKQAIYCPVVVEGKLTWIIVHLNDFFYRFRFNMKVKPKRPRYRIQAWLMEKTSAMTSRQEAMFLNWIIWPWVGFQLIKCYKNLYYDFGIIKGMYLKFLLNLNNF